MWSRRPFQHAPGVFPCKVRILSAPEGPGKWTRSTAPARWVPDVLVVHVGLALVRFRALPVTAVDAPVAPTSNVKRRGDDEVVSVSLRLPRWIRPVVLAVAAITGSGRMYLGAHLPHDVIGGAGLGMMISVIEPPQEYRARDV